MELTKMKINNPLAQRIIECHIHPVMDEETNFNRFRPFGKAQKQIDELRWAGITQACGDLVFGQNAAVLGALL